MMVMLYAHAQDGSGFEYFEDDTSAVAIINTMAKILDMMDQMVVEMRW